MPNITGTSVISACDRSGHTSTDCQKRNVIIINYDDGNEDLEEYENDCEAEEEDGEYEAKR